MRFAPFFSNGKGKACAAFSVLLLMTVFLAFYRTYLCSVEPPVEVGTVETTVLAPDNPPRDNPEQQIHQALTAQTRILQEISEDVDAVNQSLVEITVLLQEERR